MLLGFNSKTKTSSGALKTSWWGQPSVSLVGNQESKPEAPDSALAISREILAKITGGRPMEKVRVRLWDGTYWPDAAPKTATVVLNRPSALREMLAGNSETALGEAYVRGAYDLEGDMVEAFELGELLSTQTRGWTKTLSIATLLHRLPNEDKMAPESIAGRAARLKGEKNSPARDRKAIRFHYDVSNDFYRRWLDSRMVYSCAYFATPDTSLEEAQVRKLDLICRKLDLRPGERLLEIGCGWGGLLVHAATHYGVQAEGITLSEKQLEWAERLIASRHLQDRVKVRLVDYRDLCEAEVYDKAVSVGMVEHVGRQNLPLYFQQVFSVLKPGGLFLNHGIGTGPVPRLNQGESFIERYVFPDTDLFSISKMVEVAEASSFEIRDVESLREHYALTLRHWVKRLEESHDEVLHEVGEEAYRIWRIYMAGSSHGFHHGYLSVYQTLLAKLAPGGGSQASLTREGWYRR